MNRISLGIVVLGLLASADARAEGGGEPLGDPKNGLSSQAFRQNALTTNTRSLEILRTHALNHELFWDVENGYIGIQLRDPAARAVAEEMIECALGKGVTLTYDDREGHEYSWSGQLGLCQTAETGDWARGKPTEACQQLVTACLMARVNALGQAVPLSLRAQLSGALPLLDRVSTVPMLREGVPGEDPSEGTLISSFGATCAPDADCGWRPAYVGTCAPGQPVRLEIEAPSATASAQVRVCAGIHGCTRPPPVAVARPIALTESVPYSLYVTEAPVVVFRDPSSPGGTPGLDFRCPTGSYVGGFFSVMVQGEAPAGIRLRIASAERATYPAREQDVFNFLEGGFYGNLFDSRALMERCEMTPIGRACAAGHPGRPNLMLPYMNVYACYSLTQQRDSQDKDLGAAYLNSRLCALPDADCFFNRPRLCDEVCTGLRDGAYQHCKGPDGTIAFRPITTYLNQPCDMIGEGGECERVRDDALKPPRPPAGSGDSSGCGRGLTWGLAAVLILLLLRTLQRRRIF